LDRAQPEFEAAGAALMLIGQATPRHAAHFRRRQGISLPVLADEERVSYEAIGAKVGSITDLLGPKVVAKGVLTTLTTGARQGRTVGHPAQLGAAAVIGPGDRVIWRQTAEDAGDNATPSDILEAFRGAAA
jgi:hypothetical protein